MSKPIIPLNDDDMFTQIFNDPKHLPVIEEFIADYFSYDLKDVRGNIKIDTRRLFKGKLNEKGKEVDLLLDYKGRKIEIEMSTGINASIIKRNILFLANIHQAQASVGDKYREIRDTIQINLLAKDKFNELKLSFSFANIDKKIILSEFPRIDMISMEIGKKTCYTGNEETDKLIKWSKVFMSETEEELEKVLKETVSEKSKKLLVNSVARLSGDEIMVKKHEEKTKWQIEQELLLEDELEKISQEKEKLDSEKEKLDSEKEKLDSEKEKFEQEKEKDYKSIILNLKKNDMSLEEISGVMNLSIEDIKNLIK